MIRRAFVVVVIVAMAGACRFERRPPANGEGAPPDDSGPVTAPAGDTATSADPDRAADAVLRTFQARRRTGSVESVRALLDPGATLLDGGASYSVGAPASELRGLLAPGAELGAWTVAARDSLEGGRLYLLEYAPEQEGDGTDRPGTVESILVVPGPDGWRVRLLHRSATP